MIATELIEKAMRKAQGAQAFLAISESTDVSFENDKLKSIADSQSTRMSVKVIVDGKVSSSHTSDLKDVDGVVSRALEAAEFGSPAHFEFPGPQEGPQVKVHDDTVRRMTKQEMVDIGQEMIALVKEYQPEILLDSGVGRSFGEVQFANSAGMQYTTGTTMLSVGVHGQRVRGTDILFAGHGLGWRKKEIDHVAVAGKAIELFRMAEDVAAVKSGDMPVVFAPGGMNLLLLALRLGFNGKNVFLGSSPLASKLDKKVADEAFSMTDNPLIDYAGNSGRYDGEGVPHQVTPLIENGVVRNFLYDLDTAGRADAKSTGNGVGCDPTNLVVKEGNASFEEMIGSIKQGLLVHNVLGLGQGNPISGAFSVNVQLGYKIENGRIVGRVKDVMLAGNVYDALKNIVAVGNKAEWAGSSLLTPPIQIGRLSVVAK